jgi:endonuclease YncB( thermonuclease family)
MTELINADKKTPKFSIAQTCDAKCVSVYDGDTAQFVFRAYANAPYQRFSCRMLGYNSAEIKTSDLVEKEQALRSRDALAGKILNKIVQITVSDFDKYGRPLVTVQSDGIDINQWMVNHGHGQPYTGAGEKKW